MENHHHCERCGDMISPSKTYCDSCRPFRPFSEWQLRKLKRNLHKVKCDKCGKEIDYGDPICRYCKQKTQFYVHHH